MAHASIDLAPFRILALPAIGAGAQPVSPGRNRPSVVMTAGAQVAFGPLSVLAIAAMADLGGDPSVTTPQDAAMIDILMQVLGVDAAGRTTV